MPLTDAKARAAKPQEKAYRLADSGGMYLEVMPTGARYWRLKYRYAGKEKRLALGVYPEVSLTKARAKRDSAKNMLADGIDPSAARQAAKRGAIIAAANSFEMVAREWWEYKHRREVVEAHANKNLRRLELHLFPAIGKRPIAEITPGELLLALQIVERRGTVETAHRIRTLAGQIFRYAIPSGRAARDVAADLKDALQASKATHHPAITDPEKIGPLLRAIDGYQGQGVVVSAALRLAPLLFVRPGELRAAEWSEFRLDAAEWDYKPSKGGRPMIVPLPLQVVALLRELHTFTGTCKLLFPSPRDVRQPISDMTLNAALDRMGYRGEMRAHGFRAMARTLLAERLNFPPEVIEMQLAHAVKDANGRAYNRTTYLEQRRVMLQTWADYLDALKTGVESSDQGSKIVPIRNKQGVPNNG